mgnify:CR=1 FL=1
MIILKKKKGFVGIIKRFIISIALLIMDVKYAVLLGFMIGIFNIIPYFGAIVGVIIAFILLGKRTRRMGHALGSLTFPEFLGKRFDSKFIHYFSGLIIFCAIVNPIKLPP